MSFIKHKGKAIGAYTLEKLIWVAKTRKPVISHEKVSSARISRAPEIDLLWSNMVGVTELQAVVVALNDNGRSA